MANIYEYLKWRGDLTFKQSPLNDIDALIFSYIIYTDFLDIVSNNESTKITIAEASDLFFQKFKEEEILNKASFTKMAPFLLREISKTTRFKDLKLFKFIDDTNYIDEYQFCAIAIDLEDSIFISFRGTDETIIGWKENFNMLYLDETPGQLKAVEYLNSFKNYKVPLYVGGHSKGGNLAVFSSLKTSKEIKENIINIFSFDGTGLKYYKTDKSVQEIEDKIKLFLPEFCIVGKLFDHKQNYKIIKSSTKGIFQHDSFSWEVEGKELISCKNFSKQSESLVNSLESLYKELNKEDSKIIVNSIYKFLEELNIKTIDDFYKINLNTFQEFLKVKNNISIETKKLILDTIKLFLIYLTNFSKDKK